MYKRSHEKNVGSLNSELLRSECHGFALENLTPAIKEGELLVGSKTRFVRGAIPYCHFASVNFVRELSKQTQDDQDRATDIGKHGGIKHSANLVDSGRYKRVGGRHIISNEDFEKFRSAANYFENKCMQHVGDQLWKSCFPQRDYIENGWKSVLYTAPHDSCPDGRNILDFETAMQKGLRGLIREADLQIRQSKQETIANTDKVYF